MTNERKEQILDKILELMTAVAYDREPEIVSENKKSTAAEKVEMLTIKESAGLIGGLSEHTVRKLVKQGKVKSVRTGEGKNGKILVNKADLVAYFQK